MQHNSRKRRLKSDANSDDEPNTEQQPLKKRRPSPHDENDLDPIVLVDNAADNPLSDNANTKEEVNDHSNSYDSDSTSKSAIQSERNSQNRSSFRRYFEESNDAENGDNHNDSEQGPTRRRLKNFKCYNCDGVGHIARNCPKDPILICFKCGESGHSGYRCSNEICSFCLKDHPVHECDLLAPDKRKFTFCLRCGSTEHYLNQCEMPMAHRISRLQCFVCGEYGHLNCSAINPMYYLNPRDRNGANGPKRVQLCSNCGDNRHTVYFCKEMPMDKTMIAIGLSTAPHEPKICFQCLSPGHDARLCPLTIRQKRRRKQRDSKYSYRSTTSSVITNTSPEAVKGKKSGNDRKRKQKAESQLKLQEMQKKWKQESLALIRQHGRKRKDKKKNSKKKRGSQHRSETPNQGKLKSHLKRNAMQFL